MNANEIHEINELELTDADYLLPDDEFNAKEQAINAHNDAELALFFKDVRKCRGF
jgi:hypothetical protein